MPETAPAIPKASIAGDGSIGGDGVLPVNPTPSQPPPAPASAPSPWATKPATTGNATSGYVAVDLSHLKAPTYTKTQTKAPIIVSIERAIPLAASAGASAYGLAFAATPDIRPAVLAAIGAFLATIFSRVVEGVIDQKGTP